MRDLVAETQLSPRDLILPMFVADGIDQPKEISSMPGVYQHTEKSLIQAIREAQEAGVRCVDLFGVPRERSEEHTSELQSRFDLVCRLLLEKKKMNYSWD